MIKIAFLLFVIKLLVFFLLYINNQLYLHMVSFKRYRQVNPVQLRVN